MYGWLTKSSASAGNRIWDILRHNLPRPLEGYFLVFCKIFIFYIYSIKIKRKSFTLRTYQCLLQLRKKVEDIIWTGLNLINGFPTEESCRNYLFKKKWTDGFCCPKCECKKYWLLDPYKYKCQQCGYQSTITTGTVF